MTSKEQPLFVLRIFKDRQESKIKNYELIDDIIKSVEKDLEDLKTVKRSWLEHDEKWKAEHKDDYVVCDFNYNENTGKYYINTD